MHRINLNPSDPRSSSHPSAPPAGLPLRRRSRSLSAIAAAILVVLGAAACGPAAEPLTPPPPLPPEPPATTKQAVRPPLEIAPDPGAAARIAADVTYLASNELAGRGTGTPGALAAADFIAKRFAELKLTPLGDLGDLGENGKTSYLQRFQARIGAKAEPPALSIAKGGAAKPVAVDVASMITADGSASGTASGEAVFVGYGITASAFGWDDYAGADVAGKIVVILSGAPNVALKQTPSKPGDAAHGAHGGPVNPHAAPAGAANPHAAGAPPANPHAAPGGAANPHGAAPGGPPNPHAAPAAAPTGPRANALRDFGSVRYKIRTAREHKAAGVILVSATDELPSAPNDASSMGVPAVVLKRSAAKQLFPSLTIDAKGTWEVKSATRAKALPKATHTITTRVTPVMADAWNVVATLPARQGSKVGSEWVVIGAHYDHLGHGGGASSRAPGVDAVHPGADDNASGTALLLDVARRFAALPDKPARNVAFIAFAAEEVGVIGSRHWVEHAPIDVKSITAMINADMVGRLREGKLLVDGGIL